MALLITGIATQYHEVLKSQDSYSVFKKSDIRTSVITTQSIHTTFNPSRIVYQYSTCFDCMHVIPCLTAWFLHNTNIMFIKFHDWNITWTRVVLDSVWINALFFKMEDQPVAMVFLQWIIVFPSSSPRIAPIMVPNWVKVTTTTRLVLNIPQLDQEKILRCTWGRIRAQSLVTCTRLKISTGVFPTFSLLLELQV